MLVAGSLLLVTTWYTRQNLDQELALYVPRIQAQSIELDRWTNDGWESLPAYRIDLEGRNDQPINFQWGGSLKTLEDALTQRGWRSAPPLSLVSAMNWLAPEASRDMLPVLPEVNDGRHQALYMIAPTEPGTATLTVVRLWPADMQLTQDGHRIWIGKVGSLYLENRLPLISYLRSANDYLQPLETLTASLQHSPGITLRSVQRANTTLDGDWQGQVLLAWE